ncbi:hypothetical protein AncyloWKF20_08970 [Ancylobacter sp. WKF20]|uniref:hypothetical protein n=1 Tax=Ancylobacter sp. WKF20 TaxID=3039801 RepID=UPI002434682E|nr:hypothetical protein [Ancylobacter sp. WKF20]WGD31933.1 hypothetical protein AncyloWKF20_08970 [Ancylobacter sp. WKF20]
MKLAVAVCLVGGLLVAGCAKNSIVLGARDISPPRKGIFVGGLYAAEGGARSTRSGAVNLTDLCTVSPTLEEFGLNEPAGAEVTAIDLLKNRVFSATIADLNTKLADIGVDGSISDYYEYKVDNILYYSMPATEARKVFNALMAQPACRTELQLAEGRVFQVLGAYVGDVVFTERQDISLTPSLAGKLKRFTPTLKASLQSTYNLTFSGKGVVFAFIPREKKPSSS